MDKQLLRYFSDELQANERVELFHRIEKDKHLKSEFIRLQNLSAVTRLVPHTMDDADGIKNYELFTRRLKQRARQTRVINFLKYAAVASILVAITVWGTLFLYESKNDSAINKLHVPAGQRAQITLHDGTQVWLNAQSTLKYPSRFSKKKREVEIVGEAFFDVAKDVKRPFIVSSQDLELQVLGTEFNIYSYPEADYIQTDLIEGSLKIREKTNLENVVFLEANQKMICKERNMTIHTITNTDHLLWRDGIYSFENVSLLNIIEKLQLYYDVTIIVEDPEILDVQYTGKFRQRDGIDEILRILQRIQSFKIVKESESNIITLIK